MAAVVKRQQSYLYFFGKRDTLIRHTAHTNKIRSTLFFNLPTVMITLKKY